MSTFRNVGLPIAQLGVVLVVVLALALPVAIVVKIAATIATLAVGAMAATIVIDGMAIGIRHLLAPRSEPQAHYEYDCED